VAAAIQLARAGHGVLLFEKRRIGGALENARLVENYPGFPEGISGPRLAELLVKHLSKYVTDIRFKEVTAIRRERGGFEIATGTSSELFDSVILSTGTTPKKADFRGEGTLAARGLLRYEVRELNELPRLKHVGIIGGGEASMDYALNLAERGVRVTLIHRAEPKGIESLQKRAEAHDLIMWVRDDVLETRLEEGSPLLVTGIRRLSFDAILVAIGRERAVPELVGLDMEKPYPGFSVAGDVKRERLGQLAMAVGDGIQSAIEIDEFLRDSE
jgi:thioredoxin reductase (NADPH)